MLIFGIFWTLARTGGDAIWRLVMKAITLSILASVCLAGSSPPWVSPCTIFMAVDDDQVLFGNNEDWVDPFGQIRYIPASKNKYGVVYFSHGDPSPQGGMNDQGFCFDYAATGRLPVTGSSRKPNHKGNLMDQVMRECATVKEALAMHDRYNLSSMEKHQTLVCDATGDSAIIEGDVVLRRKGAFQVTTNFYRSKTPARSITCGRYKIVNELLGKKGRKLTVESMRDVLAAAHQEGKYPTQYSNVYDLKKRVVYVYHFHNFSNVVKIDLAAELKKGARIVALPSLFPKTFAHQVYADKYARNLMATLKKEAERWFPTALALNSYAYYLLVCPVTTLRNPRKALGLATEAVEKSEGKVGRILDTLAVAYYQTGAKAKALETQRQAVAALPPGDSAMRVALEARLAEFEKVGR